MNFLRGTAIVAIVFIAGVFALHYTFVEPLIPVEEKSFSGKVLDCSTGEPIAGAEVKVFQSGFGIDEAPLYSYSAQTDAEGNFHIGYRMNDSIHIQAGKEGYARAEQFEQPENGVVVKMLGGNIPEKEQPTNQCRKVSECEQQTTENGVTIFRNVCQ